MTLCTLSRSNERSAATQKKKGGGGAKGKRKKEKNKRKKIADWTNLLPNIDLILAPIRRDSEVIQARVQQDAVVAGGLALAPPPRRQRDLVHGVGPAAVADGDPAEPVVRRPHLAREGLVPVRRVRAAVADQAVRREHVPREPQRREDRVPPVQDGAAAALARVVAHCYIMWSVY